MHILTSVGITLITAIQTVLFLIKKTNTIQNAWNLFIYDIHLMYCFVNNFHFKRDSFEKK